jgi:putative nucleotidyltransferase with HDIG domain
LGSQGLQWLLLAVLTLISGSASVELPRANVSISISEAFVFTAVLLYGPAAGTLTVALDGLVISFWVARRRPELHRALFNIAAPALSAWCSSELFFWVSGIAPLADQPATLIEFLPSLVLFALVYFGLNSWLIAFVIAIQRKLNPFDVWRGGFLWLSLNYFCGASLAILLVGYNRTIDLRFVGVVVPLLLVLYFTFKTSMQRVEDANKHVDELNTLYLSTIETLAMAIDAKDQVTHGHIRRVQSYAASLAKAVGVRELKLLKAIEAAALLHDMGKLAVPEYILNKPGKLTETEFDKMKLHASIGADILSAIDFPYPVVPIVRHHHENWDGTGYPAGLKGTDIPIGARILSVVDCFDALTSDRPYRPRLGDDEAIRILLDRRGSMYDPLVVDTFIEVHRAIEPTDLKSGPPQRILNEIASARKLAAPHSETLDEIAASSDEMLTLYELAGALAGQINLADAGDLAAKHLKRLVPSALCVIYIYDRNTSEVEARHAVGDGSATVRGLRITVGHRLTGWVAANRQTIVNSDPVLDFGDLARSHALSLKSCLSTPLIRNESVLGVLSLYSTESNAFNEDHRRIIEAVARQMAHTIETTLERDAASKRDDSGSLAPLSDLEAMALTRASSCEAQDAHALLLVRTANLHHIIAVHGSNVGQEVVQSVVRHLRTVLRGNDRLFKDAAGEIVVLLPNTDLSTAQELADHIQTGLLKRPVTVSVGTVVVEVTTTVAGYPLKGETIADTLKNVAHPGNGDIVKRVVH